MIVIVGVVKLVVYIFSVFPSSELHSLTHMKVRRISFLEYEFHIANRKANFASGFFY